jgi:glycosyltransferase involved in cell wall biosynthesis
MLDWMPQEVLLKHISDADICLGAFGDTPQSLMTIQNKIYECMAMGKPVITGASPATETTLPEGVILLCNRDNPQDIADAILTLKNQPELMQQLSQNALLYYQQHVSIDSLGKQLRNHLQAL